MTSEDGRGRMTLGDSNAGGCRRWAPRDATGAGGGCLRRIWIGAGGHARLGGRSPRRVLGLGDGGASSHLSVSKLILGSLSKAVCSRAARGGQ
jgi:hypothetical protein